MEALTAASVAALTIYDMLKARDRAMHIEGMRVPAAKISFEVDDDAQTEFIALSAFGLCIFMHVHHDLLGMKMDLDVTARRIANLLLSGAFSQET